MSTSPGTLPERSKKAAASRLATQATQAPVTSQNKVFSEGTYPPGSSLSSAPDDLHDYPYIALLYLVFVFLPLFFMPGWQWPAITASVIATAVFLPLFFAFDHVGARIRALLPFAVAAIGYGLLPFNTGGNTFVIYAMVMAAMLFSPRQAIVCAAVLVALMGVEFWWLLDRHDHALAATAVTTLIGAMAVAGTLFGRARARRNAELRLTQAEVRRLAALAERERIGRDLHDLLGHTLSVVVLKSELAGKLLARDPVAAGQQIADVEQVARDALAQVREAVAGIRASGLQAELAAARLTLLSAEVSLDQRLAPVQLEAATEHALALVVREAVTNVLRHAGAQRVEVELDSGASGLRLRIADDGRGGIHEAGNGLRGMRERIAQLGGTLDIESPAGAGTRLVIHVPAASIASPTALPRGAA